MTGTISIVEPMHIQGRRIYPLVIRIAGFGDECPPAWRGSEMAEVVCAHCGRTFSAAPGKNRKYCSRACYRADTGARSEKCRTGGRGSRHGPTFVVPPSLAVKLGLSKEAV